MADLPSILQQSDLRETPELFSGLPDPRDYPHEMRRQRAVLQGLPEDPLTPAYKGAAEGIVGAAKAPTDITTATIRALHDYRNGEPISDEDKMTLAGAIFGVRAPGLAKPALSKILQPPKGRLFDFSRLNEPPQLGLENAPLERYTPARGVPERTQDIMNNTAVQKQVRADIDKGLMNGGLAWYNNDPIARAFMDELGPEKGMEQFLLQMRYGGGASPRSPVPENVRNMTYYRWLHLNDMPVPDKPAPGYGSMAQGQHVDNARLIRSGEKAPIEQAKWPSFGEDLSGNYTPVAVDAHAFNYPAMLAKDPRFLADNFREKIPGTKEYRILKPKQMYESGQLSLDQALERPAIWEGRPKKNEYQAWEDMYQGHAKALGAEPAQAQAGGWITGADTTDVRTEAAKPFAQHVEDKIFETADARGITPKQAMKDWIRGRAPLLAGGGKAAAKNDAAVNKLKKAPLAVAGAIPLAGTMLDDSPPSTLADYLQSL